MAQEAEEIVIEALSSYGIPPAASRNLIQRARKRSGLGDRPADWVRLLEGPLLAEIQNIIPVFRGGGAYAEAIERVRALARSTSVPSAPVRARPLRRVDLGDPAERERLLTDLAREEGTIGVALVRNGRAEMRFPGASSGFPRLLFAAHRLISRRRDYRVAYLLVKEAQVFMRPLGEYVVAVVAKRDANLGRVLTRLSELAVKGGQE